MTTIELSCDECHAPVELAPRQVVLAIHAVGPTPRDASGHTAAVQDAAAELLYTCPQCKAVPWRWVPRAMVAVLVRSGVTATPALDVEQLRPHYPERRPAAATPLSLEDLQELQRLLTAPDWPAQLGPGSD